MEHRARGMSIQTWRQLLGAALLACALPGAGAAQSAEELRHEAEQAAGASEHRAAIRLYEAAIAADPALRLPLAPRLARQYLWAGGTRRAIVLLEEYLSVHPEACEARHDLALALSWDDRLRAALAAYRSVQAGCPAQRHEAMLGEGRVLRWMNRPAAAEQVYHRLRDERPESALDQQARLGLAYVALEQAQPRTAARILARLAQAGSRDPAVHAARARAAIDLGQRDQALALLAEARAQEIHSAELDEIEARIRLEDGPAFVPSLHAFRDRDGTQLLAGELTGSFHTGGGGRAELQLRAGTLQADRGATELRAAGLGWSARVAPALALSARAGVQDFPDVGFTPLTGEAVLAWLPDDRLRVDLSAARVTITDNLAALEAGLAGHFGGIGADLRLTPRTTVTAAADLTRWSEGNHRLRTRAVLRHRFDGLPQLSLEWPVAMQVYDEPFDFVFFSPERYVETGPGALLERRWRRDWYFQGYLRGGIQRETGHDWSALGAARAAVERELSAGWGIRADIGWTNSNLTSSTGFERSWLSLAVRGRP
jgi:tetratricopeptide (TPR) repeat protein